jgi:hypothetical protein
MSILVQNIIVGLIVLAAAVYAGRSAWLFLTGQRKGNCCGKKSCARMDEMKRRIETAGTGKRVSR